MTLGGLLTVIGLLGFIISLVALLFKKYRPRAKLFLSIFMGAFISGLVIFNYASNEEAQTAGYLDASDKRKAQEAGFSDAKQWAEKKAELDQARRAAFEAEQKKLAEEKARQDAERQAKVDAEAAAKAIAEVNCKADLHCLGEKHSIDAAVTCRPFVERMAKNDFQWADSWIEPKFSHYRWKNKDKGVVTYIGDKIKYQNGYGAWVRHIYECDYSTSLKTILDVRARPGQLPPS